MNARKFCARVVANDSATSTRIILGKLNSLLMLYLTSNGTLNTVVSTSSQIRFRTTAHFHRMRCFRGILEWRTIRLNVKFFYCIFIGSRYWRYRYWLVFSYNWIECSVLLAPCQMFCRQWRSLFALSHCIREMHLICSRNFKFVVDGGLSNIFNDNRFINVAKMFGIIYYKPTYSIYENPY